MDQGGCFLSRGKGREQSYLEAKKSDSLIGDGGILYSKGIIEYKSFNNDYNFQIDQIKGIYGPRIKGLYGTNKSIW